jgi:hypothetical protein
MLKDRIFVEREALMGEIYHACEVPRPAAAGLGMTHVFTTTHRAPSAT